MGRIRNPVALAVVATVLVGLVTALVLSVVLEDDDGGPPPIDLAGEAGAAPSFDLAGERAADFTYERLADETDATFDDFRDGRPAVVNFFGSWCPPCIEEMPDFEEVHQALGDEVAILGLAERDSVEDARQLVDETGVTYETGRDLRAEVLTAFSVPVMPSTIFIDADGVVTSTASGAMTAGELERRIRDELL
jgi:thiol-disulfide isomerase/thioredoxin